MPMIFGRRLLQQPQMAGKPSISPSDVDAMARGSSRRRGGLFGGALSRAIGNDGDPATPNLWDWIALGPTAPDILQQRQANRAQFDAQTRQRKQEEANAAQQASDIEAFIATLPPEQQAAARLNPDAATSRVFAAPDAPDWNIDQVTGQPYTITPQGAVQYGQGRVSVRPVGGGGERAPPAGYRWAADGGSLEAIPGGPADLRAGEAAQRLRGMYEAAIRNRQNVLVSINRARSLSYEPGTTGFVGQATRGVGGTPAHDLAAEVDTIKANIGFEALQEMRANSQTGGALGQVAVRELDLLQATIANLETSQSGDQFRRNLDRVEQQYTRTLQAYNAMLRDLGGGGNTQTPQQTPQQQQRRRYNPDTGEIE